MNFSGERFLAAPRETVWRALNDPAVLADCLPGCERFDATGDFAYAATVAVRIGALAARFSGTLTLAEIDPARAVTLAGKSHGGIAGFASGRARIQLFDYSDGTRINWTVSADVGGRLANLGGRLIHAFAASTADNFFTNLARRLA